MRKKYFELLKYYVEGDELEQKRNKPILDKEM